MTRITPTVRAAALARTVGVEGLTIGRLADELSLSKSGLFAHFGSKEALQVAVTCAPVRGNWVAPWLKIAPVHWLVLWHEVHVVENPAAPWGGLVVVL